MAEIIYVKTLDQLKSLYDCSAMTWEGLPEKDWQIAADMCGDEGCKVYVIKGKVMNELCHLTGDNAYKDDLNIASLAKFKGLAMMYGGRWMDDIIDNNARREGWHPFKR